VLCAGGAGPARGAVIWKLDCLLWLRRRRVAECGRIAGCGYVALENC